MSKATKYGRYEVREVLGRGAMGVVYVAEDPVIGRKVAIKVVEAHEGLEEDELQQLQARFEREFQSAGRLSHPNIVSVHDVGQEGEDTFIAMEYVQGESLQSVIAGNRAFSFKEIGDLAAQLCSALDYAHEKGVVHRDIKPANVLITRDGRPKITDFGVAKVATATLTRTGTVVGTPAYMSPEQVTGHPVTGAADQFSLAVMLYQILTGERPFAGENPTTIMYKIVHEEPVRPSALNVAIPAPVDNALMRALKKDPGQRYPDCRELAEALRGALGAAPVEPTVLMSTGDADETVFDPSIARSYAAGKTWAAVKKVPPLRALAVAGVAVASIALVYWVFLGRGGEVPEDPPQAVTTELRVTARDGLQVWVNGVESGITTPAPVPLEGQPGEELSIELLYEGEVVATHTVTIEDGLPVEWSPEGVEERVAQITGPIEVELLPPETFTVTSNPDGAAVTFNGELLQNVTPVEIQIDPSAEFSLRVELDGYVPQGGSYSMETMSANQRATHELSFPLVGDTPPGFLAIDNTGTRRDYAVAVTIRRSDGSGRTTTRDAATMHRIPLQPGRYTVDLKASEVRWQDSRTVEIESNADVSLPALPAAVTVHVSAFPGQCRVSIDGSLARQVPFDQRLTVGAHTFVFEWSSGEPEEVRIAINEEGQQIFETQGQ